MSNYFKKWLLIFLLVPPMLGLFLKAFVKVIMGIIVTPLYGSNNSLQFFVNFFSTPPSYGTLISTLSILATLIFPTALFLENKKRDIAYIERGIKEKVENYHDDVDVINKIFDSVDNFKKNILHEAEVIKAGMVIFSTISVFIPLFGYVLFYLWGGFSLIGGESSGVATVSLLFYLFCSAISALYFADWSTFFQDKIFIYEKFLKFKDKYTYIQEELKLDSNYKSKVDKILNIEPDSIKPEELEEKKIKTQDQDHLLFFRKSAYICGEVKNNFLSLWQEIGSKFMVDALVIIICYGFIYRQDRSSFEFLNKKDFLFIAATILILGVIFRIYEYCIKRVEESNAKAGLLLLILFVLFVFGALYFSIPLLFILISLFSLSFMAIINIEIFNLSRKYFIYGWKFFIFEREFLIRKFNYAGHNLLLAAFWIFFRYFLVLVLFFPIIFSGGDFGYFARIVLIPVSLAGPIIFFILGIFGVIKSYNSFQDCIFHEEEKDVNELHYDFATSLRDFEELLYIFEEDIKNRWRYGSFSDVEEYQI